MINLKIWKRITLNQMKKLKIFWKNSGSKQKFIKLIIIYKFWYILYIVQYLYIYIYYSKFYSNND